MWFSRKKKTQRVSVYTIVQWSNGRFSIRNECGEWLSLYRAAHNRVEWCTDMSSACSTADCYITQEAFELVCNPQGRAISPEELSVLVVASSLQESS